jgi:amino acid transporter
MSVSDQVKQWLFGKPLPNSAFEEERLSNPAALAVLSSDALSSVAYATEEILLVLVLAGSTVLSFSLPIAAAILVLLTVVTLSYRQTIRAYPNGGGAYIVAQKNLGLYPGLTAGGSLLIDYILTVTVSVSAGIAALTSAFPRLAPHTVELALLAILLITWANLRGVRAAGNVLMLPTYSFIASVAWLILMGILRQISGDSLPPPPEVLPDEPLTLFLLLRAFAAGCTALTGIEAISNGVMVFKPTEWHNARKTLVAMSVILASMFTGITLLAHAYHVVPSEEETVISQLGHHILGDGFFYYLLQGSTLLILLLAANTSFADFPRLASLLAKDGFLPRQLSLLGDRLIYGNGIILLSLLAGLLVMLFQGRVNAIIPLYAVGVFTSFTLSQAGMVRHWFRVRSPGWRTSAVINGMGATVTAIVLCVIVTTKFLLGAWLIVMLLPLVVTLFLATYKHYHWMNKRIRIIGTPSSRYPMRPLSEGTQAAVVLVGQIHKGTLEALDYARSIANKVVAVHVDIGSTDRDRLQQLWQQLDPEVPLVILESPYRSVATPLSEFVGQFQAENEGLYCTIVIPVFVTRHWWENLLHNQTTWFLKSALRKRQSRVLTSVEYYL